MIEIIDEIDTGPLKKKGIGQPFKISYGKSFVANSTKKELIDKLRDTYKKLGDDFLCHKCNKLIKRYSIWDKISYPGGMDYALFKCSICKQIYMGEMDIDTKNWAICHIKTIENLVDIVV
jgi:hypothetical protein